MGKKLFIGNLSFRSSEEEIRQLFSQVGTVESANIIMDRDTGRSKGYGFVEMSSDSEAQAAVERFNNSDLGGRTISVAEAKPQERRPGGGGGGGRGGYGGGGGGGGDRGGRGGGGGGRY